MRIVSFEDLKIDIIFPNSNGDGGKSNPKEV
jgi:hypothetical protein